MFVTTNNIDSLLKDKPITTGNISGENASFKVIKCDRVSTKDATAENVITNTIGAGENGSLFLIEGTNVSMGYHDMLGLAVDANVVIVGTLTYNGERIENLIAQGGGQRPIVWPDDIECQTFIRRGNRCELGAVGTIFVVPEGEVHNKTLLEYLNTKINGKTSYGEAGKEIKMNGRLRVDEDTTLTGYLNANGGLNTNAKKIMCGDLECKGNAQTGIGKGEIEAVNITASDTIKAPDVIGTFRVKTRSFAKDDDNANEVIYLGDCEQIRLYDVNKADACNIKQWTANEIGKATNIGTKVDGDVTVGGDDVKKLRLDTTDSAILLDKDGIFLGNDKIIIPAREFGLYCATDKNPPEYNNQVLQRITNQEYAANPTLFAENTAGLNIYDELYLESGVQVYCYKDGKHDQRVLTAGWLNSKIVDGNKKFRPTVYTEGILQVGRSIYLPPFNRIQMYPTDKKGNPTPAIDPDKPLPDAKYNPFLTELKKALAQNNFTIENDTDAVEDYNYDTDKVTNEETGEEEQGTNAPSIYTKGGILALKRIISGKSVTAVDPTDLTKHSTLTPDHITTGTANVTNVFASEWVTANNATITEGISAQNGTFTNKLEAKKLEAETASIVDANIGGTCSISNLHARETTTDHIIPTEGSYVSIYGDPWVEGRLNVDSIVPKTDGNAVVIQDLSSRAFTATEIKTENFSTNEINSELGEVPVKKRMRFEDPFQGAALNRDQATEVLQYFPNLECTGMTMVIGRISFVFHRVTEYLLYVSTVNDHVINLEGSKADDINNESMGCLKITFAPVDELKKYPSNTTTEQTAKILFDIMAIASDGTVKHYDAKLVFNGTEMEVKLSGDIFELGKGETKLKTLTFRNLAGFVLLPTNDAQEKFSSLF